MTEEKTPIDEEIDSDTEAFFVDLTKIDSDMESNWWHRITGKDFGFKLQIPLLKKCRVHVGDVLVHKKKVEGKMFPDINYFIVLDNVTTKEPIRVINKMMKAHLCDKLIEFIQKNHKLPYACKIIKYFKNGNIQVDYKPTKWDRFALDVSEKRGKRFGIEELADFFSNTLAETSDNPVEELVKKSVFIRR